MERLSIDVVENATKTVNIMPETPLDKVVADCMKDYLEMRKSEEQGLLLKLPCKVGDTVYVLNKTKREIFPSRVEHIEYVVNTNLDFALTKIKGEGFCVFFDDIGKIVFLTREEAEQALEAMKEGAE